MKTPNASSKGRAPTALLVATIWLAVLSQALATPAEAWDSAAHRLVVRLAIEALPRSGLKTFLARSRRQLEQRSVEPDTRLRKLYGEAERRRHFIDLEHYGREPFSVLDPSLAATEARFGRARVERWGTLPWTVDALAARLGQDWSDSARGADKCAELIGLSGYLAHYVGDSTQPLHTTMYYDGFRSDRGLHQRLEAATDHYVAELGRLARRDLAVRRLDSVWGAVTAELRRSHTLVTTVIAADRAARSQAASTASYRRELMDHERTLLAEQLSRAASLLASIWLYEWQRAGGPGSCLDGSARPPAAARRAHGSAATGPNWKSTVFSVSY